MPNHIHNVLTILGTDASTCKKILKSIQDDEAGGGSIDFNKIIQMPESLNIESGSRTTTSLELLLTVKNPDTPNYGFTKINKETFKATVEQLQKTSWCLKYQTALEPGVVEKLLEDGVTVELGEKALKNFLEYGCLDWYEWRNKNWGTKWGAYDFGEEHNNYIVFNTAWSCPLPVIDKLTQMYPDVKFEIRWADEDTGYNCGCLLCKNGQVLDDHSPEEGTDEAVEFAANIWDIE